MSRPAVDLGFVALTDAASLIVAKELGLFESAGVGVTLHREASWATIRDKVHAGIFQGAHMLAPMVIAARLGIGSEPMRLVAPMSLNAHGAAIGLSADLATQLSAPTADGLASAVSARQRRGQAPLTFAVVFAYSTHAYMLRYWAASSGLDPDRDIRIVTAAPTGMVERLRSGEIDGFCVGAPWGDVCEAECGARIVLHASDFWPGGPDKVLGFPEDWTDREPGAALVVIEAVMQAAVWADAPENANELAELLSLPRYLSTSADVIARRLVGPNRPRFARHVAAFPWRSHAAWIFSQMRRWGHAGDDAKLSEALACYRPDLFRTAAAAVGLPAPLADTKIEGAHDTDWILDGSMGPIDMPRDLFFDHKSFDPDSAVAAQVAKRPKG